MNANYWIKHLELIPHPEGGYYKETYQSNIIIGEEYLLDSHVGSRKSSSLIYYLLKGNEYSHFHRLKSDELWIYQQGDSLKIHIINDEGELTTKILGLNVEIGEVLQVLVPANCWFAAELINENTYILLSCMVTPGFVFKDFELANKGDMMNKYEEHSELINRLTL